MASVKVNTTSSSDPASGGAAYTPRRSQRVATDLAPSDGDIWQEKLAVCEGAGEDGEPRLLIRSYYRNGRSGERVWDEPPSGAGTVLHATSDMRKKAETQKLELQLTLEMIPPEEEEGGEEEQQQAVVTKKKGKKGGFFRRFRKDKVEKQVDTARDLNLQRAIARSMADNNRGLGGDEPVVYYDGGSNSNPDHPKGREDEELALAKALSISESAPATEEEMLQRAIEESRNSSRHSGAAGVASLPDVDESSSSSYLHPIVPQQGRAFKSDPNENVHDGKLPP